MPTAEEQFTKLSGAALICVAMGNFMPSLGPMQRSDLILNVLPLGILVFTVMGKHIITLCFMLTMLLVTCSAALTVPAMKQSLKQQYESKREHVSLVGSDDHKPLTTSMHRVLRFKVDLRKYWMMALSCNPHCVLSRSCLGAASDFLCILVVIIVIQAFLRTLRPGGSVPNHRWSVMLIMITQVVAVVVGALASYIRRSAFFDVSKPEFQDQMASLLPKMTIERYWIKVFEEWEENPLPLAFNIQRRRLRRWIHFKSKILKTIRWLHTQLVFFTKLLVPLTILVPLFSAIIREIIARLRPELEPVASDGF
ncbi:hypothetical protein ACLOJK_033921 [Asimina triloba]